MNSGMENPFPSNGDGPFVGGAHHEANVAHTGEVVVNGGFKGEEEWTEERLRHNFLKRNEEKRRKEDEWQREDGAVGEKVARALGYPNEGEMSLRVAEVSIERKKLRPTTMASEGPLPTAEEMIDRHKDRRDSGS